MKQHKWHKEIKAWADGEVIQSQWQWGQKGSLAAEWTDDNKPNFHDEAYFYRIKPQPKEPQYLYAYLLEVGSKQGQIVFGLEDSYVKGFSYIGKIKLEDTEND